jgi:hypothetical protein
MWRMPMNSGSVPREGQFGRCEADQDIVAWAMLHGPISGGSGDDRRESDRMHLGEATPL